MNLWLRLLRVLFSAIRRKALGLCDVSHLDFRVMPTDLDINIHMNNARYLALMDLGRFDLIVRTGLWRAVLKQRLQPVLGSCLVRFRRPLKPFQRFSLVSRMLSWDDKWIYIEHRIESGSTLVCHAVVRGAFVGTEGIISPHEIARLASYDGPPPALPPWIETWDILEGGVRGGPASPVGGVGAEGPHKLREVTCET